ncbi:MAG: hypothetical protein LAQ69_23675 [Acidobacteriia bacterium]|nr:hypothetical protein [Terriglobia bacterium]
MAYDPNNLYNLLPAVYRERDAAMNYPLRGLLGIIGSQAALLDADIAQLYNNLFIETCADWVIPYIGDLVSNNLLFDSSRIQSANTAQTLFPDLQGRDLRPPVAVPIRADVAKTIYYRRRKATPRMLEELARDVTGWPAHVAEFFQHLGWMQNLEHLRDNCQWTDIRSLDAMDRIDGAFDGTMHTVDVRQISQQEGWYNIPNIGFFLWRINSYPLTRVPARQAGKPWQYHFSPLGNPAPLFTRLRGEPSTGGLVAEIDISAPIRPVFFYQDLENYRLTQPTRPDFTELYGSFDPLPVDPSISSQTSFFIFLNGKPIFPTLNPAAPIPVFQPQVTCAVLKPWPAAQPSGSIITVDVANGRLAIGDGFAVTAPVDVFYFYGFSANLGGGPYDRRKWLVRRDLTPTPKIYQVEESGVAPVFNSVTAALLQWKTDLRPDAIISILDSRNYQLPNSLVLRNEGWLAIEAADGQRPLLQTSAAGMSVDVLPPVAPGDPDRNGSLTLSGVVVEGFLDVIGDLGQLRLLHSTLVPGRGLDDSGKPASSSPSVIVEGLSGANVINTELKVEAAYSILGGLVVPANTTGIWVLDSIADGAGAAAISGPAGASSARLIAERSTFFGPVLVKSLQASEVIFNSPASVARTQDGCVRFSYVPPGSQVPRRYRCQPDLEIDQEIADALKENPLLSALEKGEITSSVEGWLVPSFKAIEYGSPFYAQLHLGCPVQLRTGAEDGSEMGAFGQLKQPQRESNLKIRLQEYLPFALEAGIIYVT